MSPCPLQSHMGERCLQCLSCPASIGSAAPASSLPCATPCLHLPALPLPTVPSSLLLSPSSTSTARPRVPPPSALRASFTCCCQHNGVQLSALQHVDARVNIAPHRHHVEVWVGVQQLCLAPQAAGAHTRTMRQVSCRTQHDAAQHSTAQHRTTPKGARGDSKRGTARENEWVKSMGAGRVLAGTTLGSGRPNCGAASGRARACGLLCCEGGFHSCNRCQLSLEAADSDSVVVVPQLSLGLPLCTSYSHASASQGHTRHQPLPGCFDSKQPQIAVWHCLALLCCIQLLISPSVRALRLMKASLQEQHNATKSHTNGMFSCNCGWAT